MYTLLRVTSNFGDSKSTASLIVESLWQENCVRNSGTMNWVDVGWGWGGGAK